MVLLKDVTAWEELKPCQKILTAAEIEETEAEISAFKNNQHSDYISPTQGQCSIVSWSTAPSIMYQRAWYLKVVQILITEVVNWSQNQNC